MAVSSCESPQPIGRSVADGPVYYLAKCILKGSAILQAVQGRIRYPCIVDVVFGKETSIELVAVAEDGSTRSVCEQPVFGMIKDLAILPWHEKFSSTNQQVAEKDVLVVVSDSGFLSLLTFCNEINRFSPITRISLSYPGNHTNQIGRMLAIDMNSSLISVSAYETQIALFSVARSGGDNSTGLEFSKRLYYPPEKDTNELGTELIESNIIRGIIWSMCFISQGYEASNSESKSLLAVLFNRPGSVVNELFLLEWSFMQQTVHVMSCFSETGSLAHNIVQVPNCPGFALLFRTGDIMVMDLTSPFNPCCAYKAGLTFSSVEVEAKNFVEDTCKMNDIDEEGMFNVAARALLELGVVRGGRINNKKAIANYVSSWCWELKENFIPRLIICLDSGEYYMVDVGIFRGECKLNISESIFKGQPCKTLLWLKNDFLAALVEMGDGMILKIEDERLSFGGFIQNLAPFLDMCIADYGNEKHDKMFACCGLAPEGSLRIVRSGINVEELLRTPHIYHGVTCTWAIKMRHADSFHSFLVISFVEETRVLSVGLNFSDITDSIGFLPDVCTLASGLVMDGILVQIHQRGVRLCLPTIMAHSGGISLPSPVCASWKAGKPGIGVGAVGKNFIVVASSNPCALLILGVRMVSNSQCEAYVKHHISLQCELSCISIPHYDSERPNSLLYFLRGNDAIPNDIEEGNILIVGTHMPSVEILSFIQDKGIKAIAVGRISLSHMLGTTVAGCVPQDVRLVLADRLYILCGLRNGMLLRYEWFSKVGMFCSPKVSAFRHSDESFVASESSVIKAPMSYSADNMQICISRTSAAKAIIPFGLELIAVRHIGITPVFLVSLTYSLDADIVVLSERPWLLQAARRTLVCTSISFQPSTHVMPICSSECPSGILFVAENRLHLVDMAERKSPSVHKFDLDGTPRKILFHSNSRLLLVLRTDLGGSLCSSDVCCVDPGSGSVICSFKLEYGETGKSMELMTIGEEQVVIVGTSLTCGPVIMASGEAESTQGRLIVLRLVSELNSDGGSAACSRACSSSRRSSPYRDALDSPVGANSSSSSADNESCDGTTEAWKLQLSYSTAWPGIVLAICCYLEFYFVASAGNSFYVCGFPDNNLHCLRRYAVGRTRFMITCVTTEHNAIAVGDCRDGVLIYTYHEDMRKIELLYGDPEQRLVADCALMDINTAVVSDRQGGIAILLCQYDEENVTPDLNMVVDSYYYAGEIAMRIRKGCFLYKHGGVNELLSKGNAMSAAVVTTLVGSVIVLMAVAREEYELLELLQRKLALHPRTAPVLGNDHSRFRNWKNRGGAKNILDGDMLLHFLEMSCGEQAELLSIPLVPAREGVSHSPLPLQTCLGQLILLLERVHYHLN